MVQVQQENLDKIFGHSLLDFQYSTCGSCCSVASEVLVLKFTNDREIWVFFDENNNITVQGK